MSRKPAYIEKIENLEQDVPALDSMLRALIAEEVAKCLKLSGGTMTGTLKISKADRGLTFNIPYDSGYVDIVGTDNADKRIGSIRFQSTATANSIELTPLNEAGQQMWRGGLSIQLDKNTGVASCKWHNNSVLTSAGGTVLDALIVRNTSDFIRREVNNDRIVFLGGPNWEKCAYLELFGGDNTGRAQLTARDGSNGSSLALYPDGRAIINDNPILTIVASWGNGGNWYRKYSDGLVIQRIVRPDTTGAITINLHTPMTDNTYFVVPLFENATGGEISVRELAISDKTRQSFVHNKMHADRGTVSYLVIGY